MGANVFCLKNWLFFGKYSKSFPLVDKYVISDDLGKGFCLKNWLPFGKYKKFFLCAQKFSFSGGSGKLFCLKN